MYMTEYNMHNAACMTDRTKRVRKDVRDGRNEVSARLQRYAHASVKKTFLPLLS